MSNEINYTVSEIAANEKKVAVQVSAKEFEIAYQRGFEKAIKNVQIQGFRKGKAPKSMVEKMYGSSIKWETFQELVDKSWRTVLTKEALPVFGDPKFDFNNTENFENGFSYEATCTLWPRPTVKNYEGLTVDVEKEAVTDAEVEKFVTSFREAKGTLKKIEDRKEAKKEDVANISVKVARDDGTFSETPETLSLQLGRGEYLKELENGIQGMKVDEVKVIEVAMPVNPQAPTEEAKKVRYEVTLLGLEERILAEANEDFVKGLGFGVNTLDELKAKVRALIEDERAKRAVNDTQVAIIDRLVAENPFELPQAFIDEEIKGLLVRSGTLSEQDVAKADVTEHRAQFGPIAEKRVKGILLVDAIADALKLQATPEEVTKLIQEQADAQNVSFRQALQGRSRGGAGLEGAIVECRRTKTLQLLVDKSKINYVEPKKAKA